MVQRSTGTDVQRIARERIDILFQRAEMTFDCDSSLSDRYVQIARRIAMRHRLRIPRGFRRRFCGFCGRYLMPGVSARVRIHRGKVVVTCLRCRRQRRYRVVSRSERAQRQ